MHESETYIACNFNSHIKTEGLLKVTVSLVNMIKYLRNCASIKIVTFLVLTTNEYYQMAYPFSPFR